MNYQILHKSNKKKVNKESSPKFEDKTMQGKIISNAMKILKDYIGEIFVITCSKSIIDNPKLLTSFCENVALLKQVGVNPIIIHDTASIIDETLKKYGKEISYSEGMTVMDQEVSELIEMIMTCLVNKKIVEGINKNNGNLAVGLSGKDANLIEATKTRYVKSTTGSNVETIIDLGFVGEPVMINPEILVEFEKTDFIPVITPIASGEDSSTYHLDTLHTAALISSFFNAAKLIITVDEDLSNIINKLPADIRQGGVTTSEAEKLLLQEDISYHIKKAIGFAIDSIENNTESVHVLNFNSENNLLLDLMTENGSGLLVYLG